MCRKLILLISFIAMLAMAANVSADTGISAQWDGGGLNGLWNTAANWDVDLVPDANVIIDSNSTLIPPVVNPDVDLDINTQITSLRMNVYDVGSTAKLNMDGRSMTITGDGDAGILLQLAPNTYGTVTLDINDSSLALEGAAPMIRVRIGNGGDPNGEAELFVKDSFLDLDRIDVTGNLKWYMDNAHIDFTPGNSDNSQICAEGAYTDIKWNNCTVINHGNPQEYDGPYEWDVTKTATSPGFNGSGSGSILDMNIVDSQFFWRGRWYFADSMRGVNFTFTNSDIYSNKFLIRQTTGKVNLKITNSRMITGNYHRYSENSPAGNQGTWGTIDHSVLRGTDLNWRTLANPGHLNFIFSYIYTAGNDVSNLQERIDLGKYITHDGNGVWGGPIYVPYYKCPGQEGFTVLTAIPDANYAWGYWPHDGQPDGMPMPTDLMWFPGADANHQDVYASKNRQLVEDMNEALALEGTVDGDGNSLTMTSFQQPQETWYWRIVSTSDDLVVTAGPIIQFKTPDGKAINPNPANGDGSAPISPAGRVSWTSGGLWVTNHAIYFDPNEQKVIDANTTNNPGLLVYVNTNANTYYDVGQLVLGAKYYWRVDESGGAFFVEGDIWQFTLGNYFLIEDFETYADTAALTVAWPDGGTNGTGAELTLLTSGGHESPQLMKFYFDNKEWEGSSYTERNFGGNQDWTASDTAALALHFKGDPNTLTHRIETMTLTLTDHDSSASQDYPGDPCNILLKDWFRWDAAFSAFAGIDPKKINKMKISFKDERNGYGFVYFDDFRLYQSRCIPEYTGLKADITDDCIVNADDLEEIGNDWLQVGLGTVNKTTPDANKLVLQYLFDESAGSNLADNINDYDGTYIVDPNGTPGDISDGRSVPGMSGNAFYCTTREDDLETTRYNICIDIPNDVFVDHSIVDDITLSVWMKNHDTVKTPDSGASLLEFRKWDGLSGAGGDLILGVTTSRNDQFEFVDDGGSSGESQQDWASMTDWTLFIFTKDVDSLRIYNNGVMVAAGDAGDYMKVPGIAHLGTRALEAPGTETFNDSFEGALDDFRIYSYALSPSDALGLANVASHYYAIEDPPTSSEADLYDDNKIEFKDMTVLGDEWLIGPVLWP